MASNMLMNAHWLDFVCTRLCVPNCIAVVLWLESKASGLATYVDDIIRVSEFHVLPELSRTTEAHLVVRMRRNTRYRCWDRCVLPARLTHCAVCVCRNVRLQLL